MTGTWVFVCGASGAGKDSVIGWAREHLAARHDIVFAQRIVTRSEPSGLDHQAVDPAQFEDLRRRAALAWHWQAHGYCYGIAARYARQVAWGRVVVVNGSREHVTRLAQDGISTVLIGAQSTQLAERLARRGRDAPEAIAERLARNARFDRESADLVIRNDGALPDAGRRLAGFLLAQVKDGTDSAPALDAPALPLSAP